MKHYRDEWIQEWCQENGWTDLFVANPQQYWAFPPHAVMPEPIPPKVLRLIKTQKGLCLEERVWLGLMGVLTLSGVALSWFLRCPMPVVFAFAFDAIAVANLEVDEP